MKKRSLFLYSFAAASIVSMGQVDLRMSDRAILNGLHSPLNVTEDSATISQRRLAAAGNVVELVVRYSHPAVLDEITSLGAQITSTVGTRTAIVSVPASLAEAVASCPGVTGAKVSEPLKPVNMAARAASRIDQIHTGADLPAAYDGSGVVLGLYDIGVDPNHINFHDSDGKTRVQKLWYYPGTSAQNEAYESPEQISRFDTDYGESHGTHVLGILGGSFVDPANPSRDYRGIAPGAELLVSCGGGYNAQILDGLERISKYAQEQGKPCVINVSFGDNLGPHDGSDEFTEAINDIAAKYGSIIVMAAGNERDDKIAIIKQATTDDPELRTLLLPGSASMDATFQSFGTVEIYTEDSTPFEVYVDIINRSNPDEVLYTLELPDNNRAAYLTQGDMINEYITVNSKVSLVSSGTPFQTYYSNSFIGGGRGIDAYNRRYHCQLNAYLQGRTSSNAARYFSVLRIKAQPGKKIFVYCDGTYMNFGSKNIPGFDVPDGNGTNSNMGSGPNTLAIGSYVSANVADSPYTYGTVGEISWFSSYGETPDGRTIPEACAPGQVIISSRNQHLSTSGNAGYLYPVHYSYTHPKTKKTYHWTSCAGTSQASPHVAGIVALWLNANPGLSLDDIRSIIASTSKTPSSKLPGWGYGIIDAYAGIKAALSDEYNSLAGIEADSEAVLIRTHERTCEAFIAGAKEVSLVIFDLAGSAVMSVSSAGDTAVADLSALPAGIYVARASSANASQAVKVRL